MRTELTLWGFYKFGLMPCGIIVVGLVPVAKVEVLVVGLAVPFIGGADRSKVRDLPCLIADDGLLLAVFIRHFELQKQSRCAEAIHMLGAVPVGVGGVVANARVAPAFKDDAHGIVALLEHVGHVVGVEIHALRVPGKRRFQQFLRCDFSAIEVGTINAHAANIQSSLINLTFEDKFLAEITRCQAGFPYQHIVLKLVSDPFRLPVLLVQQTDFKRLDIACKFGFLSTFGRYRRDDFPIGFVAAFQFHTCIRDIEHLA